MPPLHAPIRAFLVERRTLGQVGSLLEAGALCWVAHCVLVILVGGSLLAIFTGATPATLEKTRILAAYFGVRGKKAIGSAGNAPN